MLVPQLLLETLKDLNDHDFDEFKWFLGQKILEGCEKIPKCDLESPHRHHTVSKMVETYGEEMAVNMTVSILKKMKNNNAAEQLQKTHREGAAAQEKVSLPPVTSSSASGLPTCWKTSADGAAGAVALRAPTDICRIVTDNPVRNVGGDIRSIVTRLLDGDVGRKFAGKVFTGNVNCNLSSNFRGIIKGHVNGNIGSNFYGIIRGNVRGNVGSNFRGVVEGNVCGRVGSNFRGVVAGNIEGNVGSNFNGMLMGNIYGNVGSNFHGVVEGNVGHYIHQIFMR